MQLNLNSVLCRMQRRLTSRIWTSDQLTLDIPPIIPASFSIYLFHFNLTFTRYSDQATGRKTENSCPLYGKARQGKARQGKARQGKRFFFPLNIHISSGTCPTSCLVVTGGPISRGNMVVT